MGSGSPTYGNAKDEFERFAQEKIGPVSAEVGMPQPQIKFIDVANYLTAG